MKKVCGWLITLVCTLILVGFTISLIAVVKNNPELDNNPVVVGIGVAMAYLAYLAWHKFFGGGDE